MLNQKLQLKISEIGENNTRNIQLKMVKDISNTEFFEENKNVLNQFINKLRPLDSLIISLIIFPN